MFEEHIIVPFLEDKTPDDVYVQASKWLTQAVAHDDTELLVKGVTDPVLTRADGTPLAVTEVKTTDSFEHTHAPSRHHRAQLQAYLYALNRQHDHTIPGVVIYGDRETFDAKVFTERFNPSFWNQDVVPWMANVTRHEQAGDLPPADPVHSWECGYCEYRHRCGQSDKPFTDTPPVGFLPLHEYPKQRVQQYLASRDAAVLTPTLADRYPRLADAHKVANWECPACHTTQPWNTVDWDGDVDSPPLCPECLSRDELAVLRSTKPM